MVRNQSRQWQPTPVLLPGKSHGQRSLVGCSPWGREETDMTEWLHFHFSLSCFGEGNGNPLRCSCLENLRDGQPGGLLSMGSQSWTWLSDLAAAAAAAVCINRCHILFVHSSVGRHLSCFCFFLLCIFSYRLLCGYVFSLLFGIYLGMDWMCIESYGSFLRNCQAF